jgi:Na+-transporting NADH:ubiquinone oxidoreductase subunit NqrC
LDELFNAFEDTKKLADDEIRKKQFELIVNTLTTNKDLKTQVGTESEKYRNQAQRWMEEGFIDDVHMQLIRQNLGLKKIRTLEETLLASRQEEALLGQGQNASRIDAKKAVATSEEFAAAATKRAREISNEEKRQQAEYDELFRKRETEAMTEQLENLAQMEPAAAEIMREIRDDLIGGKITIDDAKLLLEAIRAKRKKIKTKPEVKLTMSEEVMKRYNQLLNSERVKGLYNYIVRNQDSIFFIMRCIAAGLTGTVIYGIYSGATVEALAYYYGGFMPYAEATAANVTWILSFIGTPAYYATVTVATWEWLKRYGTTVLAAGSYFVNWVLQQVTNRAPSRSTFQQLMSQIPNPTGRLGATVELRRQYNRAIDSAINNIRQQADPKSDGTLSPTQETVAMAQVQPARTAALDPSTSPIPAAMVNADSPLPNAGTPQVATGADVFGSDDPNAIVDISSSSAASGGMTQADYKREVVKSLNGAMSDDALDPLLLIAWNQGLQPQNAAAQISNGTIHAGGRRRRRTKRRGTNKRSTKRSKKTKRSRKTKRSKRAKRSRRHR